MDDLTLDVCILMTGSGISNSITNQAYEIPCRDLMNKMINDEGYYLALDDREKIKHQYSNKLGGLTFGQYFVKQMATMNKIVIVPFLDLDRRNKRSIRVELAEQGFTRNNEDYNFVIVASGTCCRKLVSHEPHFFGVQHILKKIPVFALWPSQA